MLTRYYKATLLVSLLLATAVARADRLPIFQTFSQARLPLSYPHLVPMEQLPLPDPTPEPPTRPWEAPPDDPPSKPDPSPPSAPDPEPPDDEKGR